MAMTADDKKLFRKYLADQAARATARVQDTSQRRRTAILDAANPMPTDTVAVAAFQQLQDAARAFNTLVAHFEADEVHRITTNKYSNSVEKMKLSDITLKFKTYDLDTVAALAALDAHTAQVLRRITDESSRAQLTIIANDVPGIEAQLTALAERFDTLVESL